MQVAAKMRLRGLAVWLSRLLVGSTFIISGWAKAIDPWGLIVKVNEYLLGWVMSFPREVILTGCVGLACVEFCTGILIITGSLKRFSAWVAAAMMAVMLPLTLYIAVANPVSDCGCFGDFIILSNWATFAKNVALMALIVYLLFTNHTVRGVYAAPIQWLVVTVSLAFPMFLAFAGYHFQPLVDFRPYKLGTELFSDSTDEEVEYIYEKDGVEQRFTLDNLPDSTWTYVADEVVRPTEAFGFEVRDRDGFEVNSDLISDEGKRLILVVAEPGVQFLSRAHYVNRLYEYAKARGVEMIGIAGASGKAFEDWIELTRPHFPVYSAEDTALKQLVRGDAALVYTTDGIIRWKRTLSSMDSLLPQSTDPTNALDTEVSPVDDGRLHTFAVASYILAMLVIYLLSLSPKILRLFVRHPKKNA